MTFIRRKRRLSVSSARTGANYSPHRAQFLEFVEDQLDDAASLFIRFLQGFTRRRLDVASAYCRSRDSRFSKTWCGDDCRM